MALRLLDSFCLVSRRFLKKLVFLFFRWFFVLIQRALWQLNGTQERITRSQNPAEFKAHAVKVLTWVKYDFFIPPSLKDFLFLHDDILDADYVIQNDSVSLFFLDPENDVAVFAEGRPDQMLWRGEMNPFITLACYDHAQRLIVIPMPVFHKICSRLPDPDGKLVFLGNTGRCGSTLLVQLFEQTEKIITYSEPFPLNNLSVMYKEKGHCPEVLQMTRHLIRMFCRPLKSLPNPDGYLIKPIGPALLCMDVVEKIYPGTSYFYLYRDMDKVARSYYKLSFILPSSRLIFLFMRFSASMVDRIFGNVGLPTKGAARTFQDDYCSAIFQAIIATKIYQRLRNDGANIHGLSFDDLIANKELGVRAIFKVCGLSSALVKPAMRAFDQDAQKGSIVSMEVMSKISPLKVTDADVQRANKLLVEFGFPPIGQPCRLEGTLDIGQSAESSK
ncbi:hypothetical protein CAPTEDRAFT_196175 [Capitella teleta]|uniref:Sulfotransferase domain-containing protein n=1 Tax=Capitella teleta TaxID=283909 RepID=R7TZV5_CAPTE|nr:hypothetical protein CAPTEDRAFT_196175 [Capitella teleta]|eukprot:ELT99483.1 hypothetical protein CAPTEDRAFT_196175 [Capitella teleta]